jgi:hypothetical protein
MAIQDLFGPISTRTHVIDDFDTFVRSNIPYGEVEPKNIRWGALEYDGPRAPEMIGTKPALQWHFGGIPYPITRAVRIFYTYERKWDGSGETVTDTILLGFQENLSDHIRAQPIPFVRTYSETFFTRQANLGLLGDATNQAWGSRASLLASEARGLITGAPPQPQPGQGQLQPNFNTVIKAELDRGDNRGAFERLQGRPASIDFDGPAQNSDSHNVFPYTIATLFNDPDRYSQVLLWYFAGRPRRVTKAMRIPLTVAAAADPIRGGEAEGPRPGVFGRRTRPVPWTTPAPAPAPRRSRRPREAADAAPAEAADAAPHAVAAEAAQPGDDRAAAAQAAAMQGYALFIGFTGGGPSSGA